MSQPAEENTTDPPKKNRWERFPAFLPMVAAAAFLSLFHALFAAWLYASVDTNMAWAMARFGVMVGTATTLLLIPIVLIGRRWHPAGKAGDKAKASRDLAFALAAAIAGWMFVNALLEKLMPGPFVPVLAVIGALLAAFVILAWVHIPLRAVGYCALALPILLVLAFLPFGPGGPPQPPPSSPTAETEVPRLRPAPGHSGPHPDVVLISVDTLRADRLGVYGQEPTLTPNLDRLAAEGVLFERALAASPWTIPSVASMLTGLPSARHRAGLALSAGPTFIRSPLPNEHITIAERFATAGYRNHALMTNAFIPGLGLDQGFEEMVNMINEAMGLSFGRDFPLIRLIDNLTPPAGSYLAEGVTDKALAWLDENQGEAPVFLWVHYIDPHVPYQSDPSKLDVDAWMEGMTQTKPKPLDDGTIVGEVFTATEHVRSGHIWLTEEDRQRLMEYYDRAVAYSDTHVGRLIDGLRERASGQRDIVVAFTSDHGEEFWDHGAFEHGHDYYREVTQIPMIFWGSGIPAGKSIADVVGLVDVPSTLIELAGFIPPQPEQVDEGRSLVPLFNDSPEQDSNDSTVTASATDIPEPDASTPPRFSGGNLYGLPSVMVEEGPWRFVLRANNAVELYDMNNDPGERYNIADQHPELSERYRQLLQPRLDVFIAGAQGEAAELSPETVEALRSLGYIQ